ncbi:MAG: hypothetical protein E7485_04900 [Ruminococcaceae bacterium]|nr:hypothetical protein [Oscillospiraceae bacterium]
MSKARKTALIIIAVLIFIPLIMSVVITVVNDNTAADLEKTLVSLPLPENTVFVESLSKAGKLVGNGNGMQYYGAMLISSELSLKELKEYYGEYDCEVYRIDYPRIDIDHSDIRFKTEPFPDNAYMVEMWGESPSWLFAEFDIRGH